MLNEKKIRSLKPKEKLYRLGDGEGLYIEVKPSGRKFWRYRYKFNNKSSMLSLGEYPFVSLKEARLKAMELKIKAFEDVNPKNINKTFFEVAKKYFNFKSSNVTDKYLHKQKRLLENYVYPYIKDKDIKEIKKSHLLNILENIPKKKLPNDTRNTNKAETTKRVFQIIREIFKYALHNDFLTNNIIDTIDIKQIVPKNKVQHFKAELNLDNLRKIYKMLDDYPNKITALALKFLMLTALRVGTLRNLQWDWVDFEKDIIIFPSQSTKTKEEFRLPLTNTLINILKQAKEFSKNSVYVFPSPIAVSKKMSENTLNFALKRMDLDIVPHGFRSSFSTICYEKQDLHNFSYEVIETQLSHKIGSKVTRSYLRSDFLEQRKKLLKWWSSLIAF